MICPINVERVSTTNIQSASATKVSLASQLSTQLETLFGRYSQYG